MRIQVSVLRKFLIFENVPFICILKLILISFFFFRIL